MAKISIIDVIVDVLEELECSSDTEVHAYTMMLGEALAKDLGVSQKILLEEIKSARAARREQHARANVNGLGLSVSSRPQAARTRPGLNKDH